jgi:hypothetical protein
VYCKTGVNGSGRPWATEEKRTKTNSRRACGK